MKLIYSSYLANQTFQLIAGVVIAGLVIMTSFTAEVPLLKKDLKGRYDWLSSLNREQIMNTRQSILDQ